jgi:hypothetical protein
MRHARLGPLKLQVSLVIENEAVIIEREIVGSYSHQPVALHECSNLRIEADSALRIR